MGVKSIITLFLSVLCIQVWSQSPDKDECDRLNIYLDKVLDEAQFNETQNHPDIFEKIDESIKLNCEFEGKALTIQGILYYTTGNILKAKESYFKAEKILSTNSNSSAYALNQLNLGLIYVLELNNENALICFERSLRISEELGNRFESADAYLQMGLVKLELNELDIAEEHLNSANEILSSIKILPTHGYVYHNLSRVYVKKGEYTEALKLNNKAKEIWESLADQKGLYFYSRLQSGIYSKLGLIDKEIFHMKEALEYTGNAGLKLAEANFALGTAYLKNNEPDEAEKYLRISVQNAQLVDPENLKFALKELYRIYDKRNDEQATVSLLDEVVNTFKINKDIAKLTESKLLEKDIGVDTLNKLNLSLTNATNELKRRNKRRFILFSLAGVLGLITILYITKLNRDKEKLLTVVNDNNLKLQNSNEELANYSDTINIQNEMLASKNEDLQNFAYTASHDIKSPLNTIMGYADLLPTLVERGDNDKVKIFAETINKSCKRLSDLVTDLLEYAKIDEKKLNISDIDTTEFFDDIKTSLESALSEKNVELNIDRSLPKFFQGDKIKMTQLFQNLISNSIKFSRENVDPKIKIWSEQSQAGYHLFKIQDNGIGIARKNLNKIFTMFEKLHTDTQFAGTGIGLAVCQKVAMIHKGSLEVDSEEGVGTTFTVRLPKEVVII